MSDYISCLNNPILSDVTKISVYDESYVEKLKVENERLKEKQIELHKELERKQVELPERYIINNSACILFWKDGEKTVVKRCADDEFNPRLAFLTAFFQHYVDMSKNKANKYLASLQVEEKTEYKPKDMKEKTNFKVGDIVKVTKGDNYLKKGWKGKIIKIDNDNTILVKFYNDEEHWILRERLKLIKEGK